MINTLCNTFSRGMYGVILVIESGHGDTLARTSGYSSLSSSSRDACDWRGEMRWRRRVDLDRWNFGGRGNAAAVL